jgi:hypothetical protein
MAAEKNTCPNMETIISLVTADFLPKSASRQNQESASW